VAKRFYAPDYTFAATGLAIINSGKELHLSDVCLDSWKLDVSKISSDSDDIALVPVMPFGAEVDFSDFNNFTNVIVDAAASLGRVPPKFSNMKNGWSVVYSLHATKVLGAGEGAIVVCGSEQMAESLRSWINFGFANGRVSSTPGSNAKMSEFNAAYGLASLRNFEVEQKLWLDSQAKVSQVIKPKFWKTWVNSTPEFQPYWIAAFENQHMRDFVQLGLLEAQVETRCWWKESLAKQVTFEKNHRNSSLVNSNFLSSTHLGLPMYQGLLLEDVEFVVDSIGKILENFDG
jgi:dTDP-4-amino-4,6-dideoxygalactose transaminase